VLHQRTTASSASDEVVADDELEQTSAQTVALFTTILERVTVRILIYIDDVVVFIVV
jgi:hypothetical protein